MFLISIEISDELLPQPYVEGHFSFRALNFGAFVVFEATSRFHVCTRAAHTNTYLLREPWSSSVLVRSTKEGFEVEPFNNFQGPFMGQPLFFAGCGCDLPPSMPVISAFSTDPKGPGKSKHES